VCQASKSLQREWERERERERERSISKRGQWWSAYLQASQSELVDIELTIVNILTLSLVKQLLVHLYF